MTDTKIEYDITIEEVLEITKHHILKVKAFNQEEANEKALNYLNDILDVEIVDIELQSDDCTKWEIFENDQTRLNSSKHLAYP